MSISDIRQWHYPTRIIFGEGAIAQLPALCEGLGMTRPLIVTDRGLVDAPFLTAAADALRRAGQKPEIFCDVRSNPTGANVAAGTDALRTGGLDGVIALGGGSGLDAGKAIAFMAAQDRPIWDFEDVGDNWKRATTARLVPVIAIPTTAGTGSEVGRASVISHDETHTKKIIFHPAMMPAVALCDPALTSGLPPHLTAATGFDALIHCLEAFCAPGYHPMADGIALRGIQLAAAHLLAAFENGSDMEARTHMMAAALMGATAFQKGLGGIHALSHAVGAANDTHHGLTNAVVMPYVLKANRPAIQDHMLQIGRMLGLGESGFDAVFDQLMGLRDRLGIANTLADLGCEAARAIEIGERAAKDPTAAGNPVAIDAAGYGDLYRKACSGDL